MTAVISEREPAHGDLLETMIANTIEIRPSHYKL